MDAAPALPMVPARSSLEAAMPPAAANAQPLPILHLLPDSNRSTPSPGLQVTPPVILCQSFALSCSAWEASHNHSSADDSSASWQASVPAIGVLQARCVREDVLDGLAWLVAVQPSLLMRQASQGEGEGGGAQRAAQQWGC